jgi:myo-inositol-1-phosphate synthase
MRINDIVFDVSNPVDIAPARGKLGVLLVGLGAVSTTFIAGVLAIRKGLAKPIGSLTQMGTVRLGKRTDNRSPKISDVVPLAKLDDLVFGGWDIFNDDCYAAARTAGVIEPSLLEQVRPELEKIRPWPAVFDQRYVKRLDGPNVKKGKNKKDLAEQVVADIRKFKADNKLDRMVMVWCGSTEVYMTESPAHATIDSFERALEANDPSIPSSMVYAYAAIREGIPYTNAAPNLSGDIPALVALAAKTKTPLAGKDLKTGQTLIKTIIAPGLKARLLGVAGWYSTNILGNRDGEVLDDPESFKTKEESKKSVLDYILQPKLYPDLYGDICHLVRINYYPPRGDNKEGWDNIDLFGWLGYPMQLKINFLCRDSILAAPVVLDVALFMDLAKRAGMSGVQEWLSFYFKSPVHAPELYPEHDLFIQLTKLKNTLRYLKGEELITHLGREYYD